jgi:hypothetical protein
MGSTAKSVNGGRLSANGGGGSAIALAQKVRLENRCKYDYFMDTNLRFSGNQIQVQLHFNVEELCQCHRN